MASSQEHPSPPTASPPNDGTAMTENSLRSPPIDHSTEPQESTPEPAEPPMGASAQESAAQQQQQQEEEEEEEDQQDQITPTEQYGQGSAVSPGKIQLAPHTTGQTEPNQPSAFTTGHRNSVTTTPGPLSSWGAGSNMQLGHKSAGSDRSGDRVFPIRSVISVDPATSRTSGDEYTGTMSDSETRGIPVNRPSNNRGGTTQGLVRADTGPLSPQSTSSKGKHRSIGRRATLTDFAEGFKPPAPGGRPSGGGFVAPTQLDMPTSDKDSEESGALGAAPPEAARADNDSGVSESSQPASIADPAHVNVRFTHIETEDGHSVITGRDGTLQRCEDEPIHTPGAVQGFGALVALREESDGCFIVRYASENSERMLGYSPRQLFELKNFMDILTEEQQDNLLDHIDFIRDEDADPAVNGPEVFTLSIRPPKKRSAKQWCAIHINPAHPDLVICEFELDDDHVNPLRPPGESIPGEPNDVLQANPTTEELEQSTEVLSKPLRILRSARKRRGEQGAMQVFDIMSQVQEQLSSAHNLETFLKILVGIIKELTGFHRVMIYQFDSAFNGKVVTELVDPAATKDLYYGLHFPASDIPRQARDLYKLNKVRLLYDRDQETARIVCRTREDLETPLDMSHAYLRAMSPIHLKYLGNMGVRSSMSISVNVFDELWGLIACHSYGDHGMRVSFPIRKMCRLVGDTASRNIERLSYASRLQARKLINTAPTDQNPSGYIIASSDDLLRLFDADCGLLSIQGETKILGNIEQSQEALALLEYLRMRQLTSVVASQDIREDFPDLRYPPGFQVVAGLLYVPLSVGGHDFIVFFRKGQIKEVRWAGNPYEKNVRDGTVGYLEPRSSFKTWHETVVGRCREWNEEQVETAAVLCLVYGKFIEVWRQKEAALQNSKLTRLLLANSAHEVRTPLNAIINYLEIALEGSLDNETRENLAKSHSASKSLIYVINDLLDLTKTEEGQSLVKDEAFDLPSCIKEATEPFQSDTRRKNLDYQVIEHPGLPRFVHGDGRRVRQALSNICANAVAHTDQGFVRVDVFVSEMRESNIAVVDFAVSDSGKGMSATQLDALFRDLEQVSTEEPDSHLMNEGGTATHPRTLGLGLAVVARMVRNMDGQLRLKSDEGQGSRFVVQLPFQLPEETPAVGNEGVHENNETSTQGPPPSSKVASTAPASVIAAPEGEIMLVDSGSGMHVDTEPDRGFGPLSKKKNTSANSRRSFESGYTQGTQGTQGSNKSDAERLIDAIQTPLSLHDREPTYPVSRTSSRGSSKGSQSRKSLNPTSAGAIGSPKARRRRPSSPTPNHSEPGSAQVRDSKIPVRPVKVPDDYQDMPPRPQAGDESGILFEISSEQSARPRANTESVTSGTTVDGQHLRILIAEDDPINMKIMRKRLERTGHEVFHAVNGQDCATVYKERSNDFDAVLMDMQMPIVDGLTSTQMIRACEKTPEHPGHSQLAKQNGRIPIFAVSASLVEAEKQKYIDAGFDGWILKPIDFKRLNTLLSGIYDNEVRKSCWYEPGEWERGGWLGERGADASSAEETTPTGKTENKDGLAIAGHEQAKGETEGEVFGVEAPEAVGDHPEPMT